MSFISFPFLVFFLVCFFTYWTIKKHNVQNIFLILFSCFFYGWWSIKYLFLMLGLSLFTYIVSCFLFNGRRRKYLIVLGITVVLCFLGFFKYTNFIVQSFYCVLGFLSSSIPQSDTRFEIILPLAISFHSFQLIAYMMDVYHGKHEVEKNFTDFICFSFFFPQLIAGPIERAKVLLDQLKAPRTLQRSFIENGLTLVIYGFFIKVVFADSAARIVDSIFTQNQFNGLSVILGTIIFGIQIYCDFCGYSLIAKGVAEMLGINLSWNFNLPYWAASPQEFWTRWHITLSQWLRDYLYIPLGGNRCSKGRTLANLMITMMLGGLWHGAAWNFVLWGIWHGLALVVHRVFSIFLPFKQTIISRITGHIFTLFIVFVGWYLFRASTAAVLKATWCSLPNLNYMPVHTSMIIAIISLGLPLFILEFFQYVKKSEMPLPGFNRWVKSFLLGTMLFMVITFWSKTQLTFIYFQF